MKKGTDPQHLQRIRTVFNTVAQGYDSPALRFFAFAADRLVDRVRIAPGEKVLDVAAGTGMVTVAAAQRAGPSGRVHAIDVAESMLERAEQNLRKMSPGNVDIHIMDAGHLEFRSNYFHVVCCGFGLFFMVFAGLFILLGWCCAGCFAYTGHCLQQKNPATNPIPRQLFLPERRKKVWNRFLRLANTGLYESPCHKYQKANAPSRS